jgi:D-cysteine desulfhydrase
VLATALHARALGRECTALLVSQPLTPHTRAVLDLNLAACADVVRLDRVPGDPVGIGRALTSAAAELALRRGATLIAPGGSTPAGALGYVNAGLELAEQVAAGRCPRPDQIYTPLGSGGTAAGLALGLALAGLDCEVVAVRVANLLTGSERYVRLLAQLTHARLCRAGLRLSMPLLRLRVVHRAVGKGYGHPTAAAQAAVERAARADLPCETTYTGKALAVMLDEAAAAPEGQVRMFLDTYGPIDHLGRPWEQSTEETA